MAKLTKDKTTVSLSLSNEVVEVLKVFSNRSKLIDDILSSLLLNLSPAEMLELIKTMTEGGNIVEFLIRKKCEELGIQGEIPKTTSIEKNDGKKQTQETIVVKDKEKSPKVNPKDWWG